MPRKLFETENNSTQFARIHGLPHKSEKPGETGKMQPWALRRSASCSLRPTTSTHTQHIIARISDTQLSIRLGFARANAIFNNCDPYKLSKNAAGVFARQSARLHKPGEIEALYGNRGPNGRLKPITSGKP